MLSRGWRISKTAVSAPQPSAALRMRHPNGWSNARCGASSRLRGSVRPARAAPDVHAASRATRHLLRKNQVVPEVYDPERRVAANPLTVYSEGQLNVVALSYFLGLALNARDGALPFVVLDDPLQAMDAVGVLGFADLCRRVREQRQLIVTTHDRRFADVLARKLAPREGGVTTIIHEFEGWTREGPALRSVTVPISEVASLLDRIAS